MKYREDFLRRVESLVNLDRNVQYGDPNADFQRTADFWSIYLKGCLDRFIHDNGDAINPFDHGFIEPYMVADMMILLKIARTCWSPSKEDTWLDKGGYAACGADTLKDKFFQVE